MATLAVAGVPAALAQSNPCGSNGSFDGSGTCNYSTVGTDTFTVPAYQTAVTFDLLGAGGGTWHVNGFSGNCDGYGGHARGTLAVQPFSTYQINVGGLPADAGCATGGFNGGGSAGGRGCTAIFTSCDTVVTLAGAGASDVRVAPDGLSNRIFVAGGGGGTDLLGGGANGDASAGGGPTGGDGLTTGGDPGTGGSQSAAGASPGNAQSAGFGFGGTGGNGTDDGLSIDILPGNGGGGGYYGGGASGASSSSPGDGGGGSGFVTSQATDTVNAKGGCPPIGFGLCGHNGNGHVTITWPNTPVTATVSEAATPANPVASTATVNLTTTVTTSTGATAQGFIELVDYTNGNGAAHPSAPGGCPCSNIASGFLINGTLTLSVPASSLPAVTNDIVAEYEDQYSVIPITFGSGTEVDLQRRAQTISYTSSAPTNATVGGTTYNVSASATSGLAVSFLSGSPSVCTVSGSTVSFLAVGTCVIFAQQNGDNTFSPADFAEQDVSVAWPPNPIPIPVSVLGEQVHGSSSPFFVERGTLPSGVSLSGTLRCTSVNNGTAISSSLALGTYTIDGSSCSGLTPSDSTHYVVQYTGSSFFVQLPTITVTVSGTQAYGGSPTFTYTDDAPPGVTISGNLTCTQVVENGRLITSALNAGSYSVDGSRCSGLSASGGYSVSYTGATSGFVVSPKPITVTVSGDQGYGGGPEFTYTVSGNDSGFALSDPVRCTGLGDGTTISSSLPVGSYTLDPSTCSGVSAPANYSIQYASSPDDFVVSPVTVTVTVFGTQTYGGSPSFQSLDNSGGRVTLLGTLSCDYVGTSPITGTLPVGGYVINSSTCGGLQLSDPHNFRLQYSGSSFSVTPGTITVTVAGTEPPGGPASLTYTDDAPAGVTLSGSLTCILVQGSGAGLTSLPVGTYTIDGSRPGLCFGLTPSDDTDYTLTYVGLQNGFLVRNPQSITFSSSVPSSAVVGGGSYTAAATGGASGNPVTFSVDASTTNSACSLTGGAFEFDHAGTCVIDADQAGDSSYAAAPEVQQTFTIGKGSQTITFNAPSGVTYGQADSDPGATASSTAPVSYSSATSAVCTIVSGKLHVVSPGSCTIDANQSGNSDYNAAAQVERTFSIGKGSQSITFAAPSGVTYGQADSDPGASASSGLPVSYSSTTSAVCTIVSGELHVVAPGSCTVDANQAGDTNWNAAAQVEQTFSIGKADQTITFATPRGVTYGDPDSDLGATASSGLPVVYSSTTTGVCTIVSGKLHVVAAGSCRINANQAGDSDYNAAGQQARVFTIAQSSQSITFLAPSGTTYGTADFDPAATATSGLAVSYSSASQPVCTIVSGEIHVAGVGTCTVDANQAGDGNYDAAPQIERTFTIATAVMHVDAAPASKDWGAPDPAGSATLRASDFKGADAASTSGVTGSASCSIASHSESAGTYSGVISCQPGSLAAANYTFVAGTSADLTIDPEPLAANTTPPTISGVAQSGQVLTATQGTWEHDPTSFSDQWLACDGASAHCAPIAGATGTSYTLSDSDLGHTIRFRATGINSSGPGSAAVSSPTSLVAPAPPTGSVGSTTGTSDSSTGTATATAAGTGVTAVGQGSFTLAQYTSQPTAQPAFGAGGNYFDVHVAPNSSFSTLTIENCNLNGGTSLEWWDGHEWAAVSPVSYSPGPPACVTATLGASSSPTIAQLTGTVLAVVKVGRPSVGPVTVRGAKAKVPVRCAGGGSMKCSVSVVLTKGGRTLAAAATTLAGGQSKTLDLVLKRGTYGFLARGRAIRARLTIAQLGSTVSQRTISLRLPSNRLVEPPQLQPHSDGSYIVTVHVPGPGGVDVLVTAWDDNLAHAVRRLNPAPKRFVFARAHALAAHGGVMRILVQPGDEGRQLVAHHTYRVTLRLWVSYAPVGGVQHDIGFYGLHLP